MNNNAWYYYPSLHTILYQFHTTIRDW